MNPSRNLPPGEKAAIYSLGVPATSAAAVAAELRRRLPGLRTIQLQKLLYYCQGHYLQKHDHPLFGDSMMAYDMGPLVATLWYADKEGRVDEFIAPGELAPNVLGTIDEVVSTYGHLSGRALIEMTHGESPWLRADARREPGGSVRIEPEWIRDWFRGLLDPISDATRTILDGARARATTAPAVDDIGALKARLRAGG